MMTSGPHGQDERHDVNPYDEQRLGLQLPTETAKPKDPPGSDPAETAAYWLAAAWKTGRVEDWFIYPWLVAERGASMAQLYQVMMGPPALPPKILEACRLLPKYPRRWDHTGTLHIVPPAGAATLANAPALLEQADAMSKAIGAARAGLKKVWDLHLGPLEPEMTPGIGNDLAYTPAWVEIHERLERAHRLVDSEAMRLKLWILEAGPRDISKPRKRRKPYRRAEELRLFGYMIAELAPAIARALPHTLDDDERGLIAHGAAVYRDDVLSRTSAILNAVYETSFSPQNIKSRLYKREIR
jgi:hypothetical protein